MTLTFCTAFEGHVVSERVLKAFQTLKTSRWEIAELEIVNPKGVSVAQRQYFFHAPATNRQGACGRDRSDTVED